MHLARAEITTVYSVEVAQSPASRQTCKLVMHKLGPPCLPFLCPHGITSLVQQPPSVFYVHPVGQAHAAQWLCGLPWKLTEKIEQLLLFLNAELHFLVVHAEFHFQAATW